MQKSFNVRLHSVARRRMMLSFYALLLVAVAVAVLIVVLAWSSSKQDDRLTVIANFLAGGTLLLALLAGIVALQAYAAATGLPDLKVRLEKRYSAPNMPAFVLEDWDSLPDAAAWPDCTVSISVANVSKYSANNPAIIVGFRDAGIVPKLFSIRDVWTPIDWTSLEESGVTAVQWDGGSTYSIHGKSIRRLPTLNLQGLHPTGDNPRLMIRLLADGYVREKTIPLTFTHPGDPPVEVKLAPEWL